MSQERAPSDLNSALARALEAQAKTLQALAGFVESLPDATPSEFVEADDMCLDGHTFRRAAKEGEFEVFKVGRKRIARRTDVRRYIERQRERSPRSGAPAEIDALLDAGRLRIVPGLEER